jgi:hypothetical protein
MSKRDEELDGLEP